MPAERNPPATTKLREAILISEGDGDPLTIIEVGAGPRGPPSEMVNRAELGLGGISGMLRKKDDQNGQEKGAGTRET